MKKHTSSTGRKLTYLMLFAGTILTSGLLGSCAYTETMNERNAEGARLQHELGNEIQRGHRLSH